MEGLKRRTLLTVGELRSRMILGSTGTLDVDLFRLSELSTVLTLSYWTTFFLNFEEGTIGVFTSRRAVPLYARFTAELLIEIIDIANEDVPSIFLITDEYLSGGWIRSHVDDDWLAEPTMFV